MASDIAYLEGKKLAPADLGDVLILGLGKSGKSALAYCAALLGTRVRTLYVAAGADTPESRAFVETYEGENVVVAFGDDAVQTLSAQASGPFDVCIASPGIPYWAPLYEQGAAASAELISEVEFAWRESAAASTWIAITGTNGKTTVTSWLAYVLSHAGFAANAVGNIGDVCLDAVAAGTTQVYVAEVSSYQLASTKNFAPNVAVQLNITPDHIHWHKTLEAYRDAKFKMFDNLSTVPGAVAVLDATCDVVRAKVRELKALSAEERGFSYIPVGTRAGITGDMRAACGAQNAAFVDGEGRIVVALNGTEHVLCNTTDLLLKGEHNVSNAIAVASAAVAAGAEDAAIAAALATFEPLEHRIEPCGVVRGIACYNDSKATNVDATCKALCAFPGKRLVVLLGGDDKDTDLSDLIALAHKTAQAVVCFGAAGDRFEAEFTAASDAAPANFAVLRASHLEDALDTALAAACDPEVVLLSPACASFDEFKSFEHRGRVFKDLVAARAGVR